MNNEIKYIIRQIESQGDNNKFIKLGLEIYGLPMDTEGRILCFGTWGCDYS